MAGTIFTSSGMIKPDSVVRRCPQGAVHGKKSQPDQAHEPETFFVAPPPKEMKSDGGRAGEERRFREQGQGAKCRGKRHPFAVFLKPPLHIDDKPSQRQSARGMLRFA